MTHHTGVSCPTYQIPQSGSFGRPKLKTSVTTRRAIWRAADLYQPGIAARFLDAYRWARAYRVPISPMCLDRRQFARLLASVRAPKRYAAGPIAQVTSSPAVAGCTRGTESPPACTGSPGCDTVLASQRNTLGSRNRRSPLRLLLVSSSASTGVFGCDRRSSSAVWEYGSPVPGCTAAAVPVASGDSSQSCISQFWSLVHTLA